MSREATPRLVLADFQATAVDGLAGVVRKVAQHHIERPDARREIALKSGVTLLQSPTGSGKTLILGRTLEGLKGALPRKVVWFWFAPFTGLVAQTREALAAQCGGLRLRDIGADRASTGARDGDVFVTTWASVAANNKDARKVRRSAESALSLDEMIADLRADGTFVGVVIDEAHLNFGASAKAAADFYINVLQPDFTLLATATPNDDKLEAFEARAGIEVASRVVIGRDEVVRAGLNKSGLMLGIIRFKEGEQDLVEPEHAALAGGWMQHRRVMQRLEDRGIGVVPLMLVQVEDQAAGGEDPIARVRKALVDLGVPDDAIAVHTSGEPDPDFHTLAYDPAKQVLIFKVAVATGFDAPRAWTLVSVRPNRGREFGLQIVGRIMRVHPSVRSIHGEDSLLDRGYVFLTDPEMQTGLGTAVDELKAIRQSVELITDRLDVFEYSNVPMLAAAEAHSLSTFSVMPPASETERSARLAPLVASGMVPQMVLDLPAAAQDAAIVAAEQLQQTPLFYNLPETVALRAAVMPKALRPYPLRTDIDIPRALFRELPPDPLTGMMLVDDIASEFARLSSALDMVVQRSTKARLSLRDLFGQGQEEALDLKLRYSNARIAEQAQLAFEYNRNVDVRKLKAKLVDVLRGKADDRGLDYEEKDLRRAVDLAVMREPDAMKEAIRLAQSRQVRIVADEPLPPFYFGPDGLPEASKSAYGVFPERMNQEERSFAELLDRDDSGIIKWWMRNPENERWATQLILPSGKKFYPDFVVRVAGRSTPGEIALVEIKDDGDTGRLQSDRNIEKVRVQHREYKNVFWAYRIRGEWVRGQYNEFENRIAAGARFDPRQMAYLQ
jgi:type III restriction enzyme